MNQHIEALFQFTRSQISERHLRNYLPRDYGYMDYLRLWTRLFHSGEIPKQWEFDLREVISLTSWASLDDFKKKTKKQEFRQFRRFTSAVAVALIDLGNYAESIRVPNYLARDLIIDTNPANPEHFELVRHVFPVMRDLLKVREETEYPFFTMGSMILAQWAGDYDESAALASQLIDDECAVRDEYHVKKQFLFGLNYYFNQLNEDWIHFCSSLKNPNNDRDLQFILNTVFDSANQLKISSELREKIHKVFGQGDPPNAEDLSATFAEDVLTRFLGQTMEDVSLEIARGNMGHPADVEDLVHMQPCGYQYYLATYLDVALNEIEEEYLTIEIGGNLALSIRNILLHGEREALSLEQNQALLEFAHLALKSREELSYSEGHTKALEEIIGMIEGELPTT